MEVARDSLNMNMRRRLVAYERQLEKLVEEQERSNVSNCFCSNPDCVNNSQARVSKFKHYFHLARMSRFVFPLKKVK